MRPRFPSEDTSSRSLISDSFAVTRSALPPFSNSILALARFFTAFLSVVTTSVSSMGFERSIEARWIAASAVLSEVAAEPFLAFIAVTISALSCS